MDRVIVDDLLFKEPQKSAGLWLASPALEGETTISLSLSGAFYGVFRVVSTKNFKNSKKSLRGCGVLRFVGRVGTAGRMILFIALFLLFASFGVCYNVCHKPSLVHRCLEIRPFCGVASKPILWFLTLHNFAICHQPL